MIINSIKGKNIASLYGNFEVDFRKAPLADNDLFAITGDTGSGKSSILDTLCLALFGRTPRLGNERKTDANRYVFDPYNENITLRDPRRLMSNGESECSAEVNFTGNDGEEYVSSWNCRRARTGTLQKAEMSLSLLKSNVPAPCERKIEEVLGMDFDQFCKTVLLSQGEFQKFLEASDNEKSDILEKITGTDRYFRIGAEVHQTFLNAKRALDAIQERSKGLVILSPEELEAKGTELKKVQADLKYKQDKSKEIESQIKWREEHKTRSKSLEAAKGEYQTALQADKDSAPDKKLVSELESLRTIRPDFTLWKNALANVQTSDNQLKEIEKSLQKEGESQKSAETALTNAQAEETSFKEGAYKIQRDKILRARDINSKMVPVDANYRSKKTEVDTLSKAIADLEGKIDVKDREIERLKSSVSELEEWFKANGSYSEICANFTEISTLLSSYNTETAYSRNDEKKAQDEQKDIDRLNETLKELTDRQVRIQGLLPADIALLRSHLVDGEACPVCGSTVHPDAHKGLDDETWDEEKEKKTKAEAIEELMGKIDDTKNKISTAETNKTTFDKTSKEHHEEAMKASVKLEPHFSNLTDWKTIPDLLSRLTAIQKQWTEKSYSLQKATADKATAESNRDLTDKQAGEKKAEFASRKNLMEEAGKQLDSLKLELKGLIGEVTVDEAERQNEAALNARNNKVKEAEKAKADSDNNISSQNGQKTKITETRDNYIKERDEYEGKVNSWLDSANSSRTPDDLLDKEVLTELFAKYPESWIVSRRTRLDKLKSEVERCKTLVDERKAKLDEWEATPGKPDDSISDEILKQNFDTFENDAKELDKQRTSINGALEADSLNREAKKKYEADEKKSQELFDKWKSLDDVFGRNEGMLFKRIAQSYALRTLVEHTNLQLDTFMSRYQLVKEDNKDQPDSLSLLVADSDQGGALRTTSTLSGGEKFIVSLSLALGLSSLASNRMSVKSLFIDEGFGSLDNSTLNTVMNSLDQMQTQGRKVGIISHVQEINDRVSTQIKVEKEGNGHSKITIQG